MRSASKTRQPAQWPSGGLNPGNCPEHWQEQSDLAREAHERTKGYCTIGEDGWRVLVSAVRSGLPVVITTRGRGYEKATYVVQHVTSLGEGTTSNLYVQTWGFAHPLSLSEITAVSVPPVEYASDAKTESEADNA